MLVVDTPHVPFEGPGVFEVLIALDAHALNSFAVFFVSVSVEDGAAGKGFLARFTDPAFSVTVNLELYWGDQCTWLMID